MDGPTTPGGVDRYCCARPGYGCFDNACRMGSSSETYREASATNEYTVVLQATLELRLEGHEPKRVGAGEA